MLKISNISKCYGPHKVLSDISFELNKGHSYSLVGKSGCGKSTLSRIISGIEKPDQGSVVFNTHNIHSLNKKSFRAIRKDIQIVFQDAYSSLNPRWSIYNAIKEPIENYLNLSDSQSKELIHNLIRTVGLSEAVLTRRPKELSGGQQKRVCIARAISCNPDFIILDESVSGLDTQTKSSILNLLIDLQDKTNCTYLLITHDIEVAYATSDTVYKIENTRLLNYKEEER